MDKDKKLQENISQTEAAKQVNQEKSPLIEKKVETPKLIENEETKKSEESRRFSFKKIWDKIKTIKERIVTFFQGIKGKIKSWIESYTNIRRKIELISDFIKNEINREAFRITYSSLKKLLKHILPTKLESNLIFGTGDPCTTGQALGAFSLLYSFYGDKIKITPDFENQRFEGKHYARGRIRLVTILIIVIKLILDKRFKQFTSNFKTLKEAL
jgi:hypothetical protein